MPQPVRRPGASDRFGRFVLAPVAVVVALLLVFPGGSLLPTLRPWLGLIVPVLLLLGLLRRSRPALIATALPLVAWPAIFGGHLLPDGDAPSDLVVVQHNVSDENPDPAGTVSTLVAAAPDLVALEEITPEAVPLYAAAFPTAYAHHTVHGTVALWSRHPLTEAAPLDIRPAGLGADWNRGLRAVTHTPHGDVAVYVAHLSSVRPGLTGLDTARRDDSAAKLGVALTREPLERVILLGDLNATVADRGLAPVTAHLSTDGSDFAFTFPAALPIARIDHVLARSLSVTSVRTLPRTGSDHLPIIATLHL
ncbi:endonuclease/exonuclease/phosphatase family protein [Actinoplanes sp. CA-252034]|uniref:endonuclease/exonuclease/phosphatase family protein n=1 Tax=Actinoplanes sp. CA-252034 TaxID=3239906 RepID=UPI003D99F476